MFNVYFCYCRGNLEVWCWIISFCSSCALAGFCSWVERQMGWVQWAVLVVSLCSLLLIIAFLNVISYLYGSSWPVYCESLSIKVRCSVRRVTHLLRGNLVLLGSSFPLVYTIRTRLWAQQLFHCDDPYFCISFCNSGSTPSGEYFYFWNFCCR